MKRQHISLHFRRVVLIGLLLSIVLAERRECFALDIYVSVDGDAQADGSPGKPYGSLPDAVDAVRTLPKAGNAEPVKIILREGRHQLNQTLVLSMEDGSPAAVGDVTLEEYSAGDTTGLAFLTFAAYPLCVDPAGGDFSFRPGSPALALGIEPLDVLKMGRLKKRSYLNSDGSLLVPKDFYPKFSWDTTPRYFMFGDKNRVLSPEQVRFIAEQTDFVCIEKSHGMGELGAAELGAKHEAAALKNIKPGMKVLFYFNAAYAWPYTSYNKDFTKQRIDKNPKLKEFLITDSKTGELAQRFGVAYCYDVLNPKFRDWWVKTVAKGVKDAGCDGAFVDQMHGNVRLRPDKGPEIEEAMGQMMAALKTALGPERILLANNAYNDDAKYVYPVSDAIMFENYATVKSSKESLLAEWGHMLRIAKDGKISVFRLGVEGTGRRNLKPNMPELSQEKVEFALACYLIGAQPYSYFMYSWGWTLGTGALVEYPELKKPLGPPKGAYQRTTPEGWEFTRGFEHASVWVNTETRQAKITWR